MKYRRSLLEWIIAIAVSSIFFVYKISSLTFRYGDHNLYFFEADKFLQGILPHRDFFLTDTGFYIILLAGIKSLIGTHILWLQILPIILHIGSAVILFLLLKRWGSSLAFIAPPLYLFSFSVLANSDYATGEDWVVFLLCSALLILTYQRPKLTGLLLALACLIKLYAITVVIGICLSMLIAKNYVQAKWVILAGFLAGSIALIFLAIPDPGQFLYDVILFNFNRPAGLEKTYIFLYFFQREWPLLLLASIGVMVLGKKRLLICLPIIFSLLFFSLFKDIYYLYLQILLPFLVIGAVSCFDWIFRKPRNSDRTIYSFFIIIAYAITIIDSIIFYQTNWQDRGRFTNAVEVATVIKNLPETYPLYGLYDLTPLLSLLSGRSLYKNYFDTNSISFDAGRLNKNTLSLEAVQSGVYLVAHVVDLPEYDIKDYGYQNYFSEEVFLKFCSRVATFPSTSNSQENYLNIYKCKSY